MTLFRRSRLNAHLVVLSTAILLAASFATAASADRKVRASAGPKASVSVAKCRSAATYAERRLEFRASMSAISGGGKMELRYTLYRRFNNQSRFRAVTPAPGSSLAQWLTSSDPAATRYIHSLAFTPIETAAEYRVKVSYRWLNSNGKIVKRAKRTSKLCKQRRGLPDLKIVDVQRYPNSGTVFPEFPVVWAVTIQNVGASSASFATSPILSGTAAAGLTDGTVADSLDPLDTIPAGGTLVRQLYGQECRSGPVDVTVDPLNVVREKNENDNGFKGAC